MTLPPSYVGETTQGTCKNCNTTQEIMAAPSFRKRESSFCPECEQLVSWEVEESSLGE